MAGSRTVAPDPAPQHPHEHRHDPQTRRTDRGEQQGEAARGVDAGGERTRAGERRDPQRRAERRPPEEAAERHARRPRRDRHDRVHDRDEPRGDQRGRTTVPQVRLGPAPPLHTDPPAQPGPQQARPERPTDGVPGDLTEHGARGADRHGQREAGRSGRQRPGQHHHGLAGHQQAQQERHLDGGGQGGEQQHQPRVDSGQPVDEGRRGVEQRVDHPFSLPGARGRNHRVIPREPPDPAPRADPAGPGLTVRPSRGSPCSRSRRRCRTWTGRAR